jgi:hypothetical protein
VETFFNNDTDHDSQHEPKHIPATSPDALTSSTRTNFTYPPIEDPTKTLLKYAKNANLCKLANPTDLQAQGQYFNTFIDNLRIVCNISPWTRQVFDLWPQQVPYSHPFIGSALYNLIFTNVSNPCQKHIIDGPPDTRTAILTLGRILNSGACQTNSQSFLLHQATTSRSCCILPLLHPSSHTQLLPCWDTQR